MAISPRTEAFMQPPPNEEDATQAFEEGFSQLAHRIFSAKFPELVENVVTFKIHKSDIDTGSGVGAFILSIDGQTIFVPTILANNQVKPLAVMYFKEKNIFLPLDKAWIEEVSRGSLDELGTGVKPPETLDADADIRQVVVPPITGRFAYAAAGGQPGQKLTKFLSDAPNYIKQAFAIVLERNPNILKFAFENFDKSLLLEALRPTTEKTASDEGPKVAMLTPDDSAEDFRNIFGSQAGAAWQVATKLGYVIQDKRHATNIAIETEEPLRLTTATKNGLYRIRMRDGVTKNALVIAEPQQLESPVKMGKRTDMTVLPNEFRKNRKKAISDILAGTEPQDGFKQNSDNPRKYLIYTADGNLIESNEPPVGEPIPVEVIMQDSPKLAAIVNGTESSSSGRGFFVGFRNGKFFGTCPIEISSVTTGSDGVRRMMTFDQRAIISSPKNPISAIVAPKGSNVVYMPTHYQFIKAEYQDSNILEGAGDTLSHHKEILNKIGALEIAVKNAGAGMFSIGGLEPREKLNALGDLVCDVGLRVKEAEAVLRKAEVKGSHAFYLVNPEQFHKFAAQVKQAQPPQDAAPQDAQQPPQDPSQDPTQDPSQQMAMDPSQQMPAMPPAEMIAPPPSPNPVEMAVGEIGAQLAQEASVRAQQLADEHKQLAENLSLIQAVRERANQIAGSQGMPPAGDMGMPPGIGIPSADESMGGGMPPEMSGEMPPEGMGEMPPEGMGAEMPGGGMPPMGGQIPGAMQGAEIPQAGGIAANAAPMMDEAAKLNDPDAFESTAIGAMSADSDLRQAVSDYIPAMEETLDNLGRLVMTLWMQEDKLQEELGEDDFVDIESRLLSVFKNLGSLILRINQTAMPGRSNSEEEAGF